jgi:hypothetical protein
MALSLRWQIKEETLGQLQELLQTLASPDRWENLKEVLRVGASCAEPGPRLRMELSSTFVLYMAQASTSHLPKCAADPRLMDIQMAYPVQTEGTNNAWRRLLAQRHVHLPEFRQAAADLEALVERLDEFPSFQTEQSELEFSLRRIQFFRDQLRFAPQRDEAPAEQGDSSAV